MVIGIVIGRWWAALRPAQDKASLNAARAAVSKRKEKAKAKILELFATKSEVANDDVQKLLGVSDATATNYLSELEAKGKLIQIGTTGRPVRYRKNG